MMNVSAGGKSAAVNSNCEFTTSSVSFPPQRQSNSIVGPMGFEFNSYISTSTSNHKNDHSNSSMFHLTANTELSPLHATNDNYSPYHVPSSTESPFHGPDDSPMYLPNAYTSLEFRSKSSNEQYKESKQSQISSSLKSKQSSSLINTVNNCRKRLRNSNSQSNAVHSSTYAPNSSVSISAIDAKSKKLRRSVNQSNNDNNMRQTCKMSDSDKSDSEYDTSDMDEAECSRQRRVCVDHMDGLSTHLEKFKERCYTDQLMRLEKQICDVKKGQCAVYRTQIEKEQTRLSNKTLHLSKVLSYKLKCVKNIFEATKAVLANEKKECFYDFEMKIRSKLLNREERVEKIAEKLSKDSVESEAELADIMDKLRVVFREMFVDERCNEGEHDCDEDMFSIGNHKGESSFVVHGLDEQEIENDLNRIYAHNFYPSSRNKNRDDKQSMKPRMPQRQRPKHVNSNHSNKKVWNKTRSSVNKSRNKPRKSRNSSLVFAQCVPFIEDGRLLCLQQSGKNDFYGYATEVDLTGALILVAANERRVGSSGDSSRVGSHMTSSLPQGVVNVNKRCNDMNDTNKNASSFRRITIKQINTGEVFLKPM